MDEAEILDRCRKGDEEGFAALFERYQRPAWRLAYTITGDQPLADDVLQEAFIQAFRALDNLWPGAPFGPWFYAIVANRARRSMARKRWWLPLFAAHSRRDERAADAIAGVDLKLEIWGVVQQLPVDLREVVGLRYALDLSEAQAAAVLGIPVGTVKSRLHRAKQLLQHRLGPNNQEGVLTCQSSTS